jgi:sugar phosphate isomerase/epimerase
MGGDLEMNRLGYIVIGEMTTWPAEVVLERLASAGAGFVDWDTSHFDPSKAPAADLVRLAEQTRAAGLDTRQFIVAEDLVAPDPEKWEERVTCTERALDACAEAEIPSIDVITGPKGWDPSSARVGEDLSERDALDLALRALERIIDHAEGTGVTVSLEPVWGTLARSARRADEILTRLRHPSLGLTVDPSHFVLTSDDFAAFVRRWREIVCHVHLKDSVGREGAPLEDFAFVLPGEGAVDWPAFFGAVDEANYSGPLMVEFESYGLLRQSLGGDATEAARLSLSLAAGLLEHEGQEKASVEFAGEAK